ncbi:MAG TPA: M48 family metallopeptidase, partial [Burkholderiaceae bacterium]|nr:M48 family metallopeptidase [Burkholderiaceae bacterium]
MPTALNSDTPYLQQLSPEKAKAPADDKEVREDVRRMQSLGLGLVYYPELEQLLNDELQRIKATSGFVEVPGRVYILASPTMNALTTDQGNIYVPIGMLMDIQSMDEVDALLAHELAHTVLSHTDVDIVKEIQKKGTAAYGLVNRLSMDASNAESAARRIRNSMALYMATEKVISPTWSRTQETDADKLAVDFLVQAGRNVNGMTALLGRLDQWGKINATLHEKDKPKQSMLVTAASSQFAQNEWQALLIQAADPIGRKIEDGIA